MLIATFCVVLASVFFATWEFPRGAHHVVDLLPDHATEIQEYHEGNGFHPDVLYAMKAKISHEEFERVARKLKLTKSEMEYDRYQIVDWWILDREKLKSFYRMEETNGSQKVRAGWQEGYIYFVDSIGY